MLRSTYPGLHYADILVLFGLQSVKKRRDNKCKVYFNRLKFKNHRLNHRIHERRDVYYGLRNAKVCPIPVGLKQTAPKTFLLHGFFCNWQYV